MKNNTVDCLSVCMNWNPGIPESHRLIETNHFAARDQTNYIDLLLQYFVYY